MRLKEYIVAARTTIPKLSIGCGVAISSIYKYIAGKPACYKNALRIENFTKGKVTVEELMNFGNIDAVMKEIEKSVIKK